MNPESDGLVGRIRQIQSTADLPVGPRREAKSRDSAASASSGGDSGAGDPAPGDSGGGDSGGGDSRGDDSDAPRIENLLARVADLEQLVQGLQDSVYRESKRLDRWITELEARIDPAVLAAALSRDARQRGL